MKEYFLIFWLWKTFILIYETSFKRSSFLNKLLIYFQNNKCSPNCIIVNLDLLIRRFFFWKNTVPPIISQKALELSSWPLQLFFFIISYQDFPLLLVPSFSEAFVGVSMLWVSSCPKIFQTPKSFFCYIVKKRTNFILWMKGTCIQKLELKRRHCITIR